MRALDYAEGLLAMARKDFDALRGMVDHPLFAVQARYEAGLMEAEAPIGRESVIVEVRQLLDTVAVATGMRATGRVNEGG
jgi:hypothetical protein